MFGDSFLSSGFGPFYSVTLFWQVGSDCVVAEGFAIGEKSSVKKSVVGKHVTIGASVKLDNCIVHNHVRIEVCCSHFSAHSSIMGITHRTGALVKSMLQFCMTVSSSRCAEALFSADVAS